MADEDKIEAVDETTQATGGTDIAESTRITRSETSKTVTSRANKIRERTFDKAQKAVNPLVSSYTGTSGSIASQRVTNALKLANRNFFQHERLLARRRNANQRIQQLNADYVVATQDVLNEKTLNFLVDHSKINVPTFTSIVAGFELARASRADKLQELVEGEKDMINNNMKAEQDFVYRGVDPYYDDVRKATDQLAVDSYNTNNTALSTTTNSVGVDVREGYNAETTNQNQQYNIDKMVYGAELDEAASQRAHRRNLESKRFDAEQRYALSGVGGTGTTRGSGGGRVFEATGIDGNGLPTGTTSTESTNTTVTENTPQTSGLGLRTLSDIMGSTNRGFRTEDLMVGGNDDYTPSTTTSTTSTTSGTLNNRQRRAEQLAEQRRQQQAIDYAHILQQGPETIVSGGQGGRNRVVPTKGYQEAQEFFSQNGYTSREINELAQQERSKSFFETLRDGIFGSNDAPRPNNARISTRYRDEESQQGVGQSQQTQQRQSFDWRLPNNEEIYQGPTTRDEPSIPETRGLPEEPSLPSGPSMPGYRSDGNFVPRDGDLVASQDNGQSSQEDTINIPLSQLVAMVNNPNVSVGPDGNIITNVPKEEDDDDDNTMIVG